jgi:hypothetical protein
MKFKKYVLVSLIGISSLFYLSATTGQVDYFEVSKNIDIFVSLFKELNVFYVDKILQVFFYARIFLKLLNYLSFASVKIYWTAIFQDFRYFPKAYSHS